MSVLFALLLTAVAVVGARAALMTFIDSYVNGSDGITSNDSPFGAIISPDGQNLYAINDGDRSVVAFSRNTSNGTLSFLEDYVHGDAITGATLRFSGINDIAISPDGEFVYVVASSSGTVNIFSRDSSTGLLTHKFQYDNGDAAFLAGASAVRVSPDGDYLFIASSTQKDVSAWSRDSSTGDIAPIDHETTGATGGVSMDVSPDGKYLYFGDGSAVLYVYSWNGAGLSLVGTYQDGVASTKMHGVRQVRVSPDGKNVLIAGTHDDSVVVFTRNAADGTLTLLQEITDNNGGVNYLDGPENIAVSPSGSYVYVGANSEDAITVFSRDSGTGMLTYVEEARDGVDGVTDMDTPYGLGVVSPDCKSLYVSGYHDAAIVQFATAEDCSASEEADTSSPDGPNPSASKEIAETGTTTLTLGDVLVSVPSSAVLGETNCRIEIEDTGNGGDFGFTLNDSVFDVNIVCDSGVQHIFFAPITICIRPDDGIVNDKQVFHRHDGASSFTGLTNTFDVSGYVCGQTRVLSLFTLGDFSLPATGFAPDVQTELGEAAAYADTGIMLDIPELGLTTEIVGVPQGPNGWDVSWLGDSAGYLVGTAFPTLAGNTVITAHVWGADNQPGPFYELESLGYGDRFSIEAWGSSYTYEVRSNTLYSPSSLSPLGHEDYDWVTLVTCQGFDEASGQYIYRRVVRAVLVSVD